MADKPLIGLKKYNKQKNIFSYYYLEVKNFKKEFKPLFVDITYDLNIINFKEGIVTAITYIKHKKQVIQFPIGQPKKWTMLTPTYKDAVFTYCKIANNKVVTSYESENSSLLTITGFNGNILG